MKKRRRIEVRHLLRGCKTKERRPSADDSVAAEVLIYESAL
jgi:hypothetical protein